MIENKTLLILDMNGTFVFNHDRFSKDEDYSIYYSKTGGKLSCNEINTIINEMFDYLIMRYENINDSKKFPSLYEAIDVLYKDKYSNFEVKNIIDTFSYHELGTIPKDIKDSIELLSKSFQLAIYSDIWSPSDMFIDMLKREKIYKLFSFISYSSDIKIVKPSKKPIENILNNLDKTKDEVLFIGDSLSKDYESALLAGIDFVLIGKNADEGIKSFDSLVELKEFYI